MREIGQIAYESAKAGIIGVTLVAAPDMASPRIRCAPSRPVSLTLRWRPMCAPTLRPGSRVVGAEPAAVRLDTRIRRSGCTILRNAYLNGDTSGSTVRSGWRPRSSMPIPAVRQRPRIRPSSKCPLPPPSPASIQDRGAEAVC
jgi:hypothetical protein